MSWTEQNAFKRIYNVFKRNKTNVYKEDIDALKLIDEAIQNKNRNFITNNVLFAKLLALQLNQNLVHYGTIEHAIKKLKEDISQTLDYDLILLQMNLNNSELINYFNLIGLNTSNPMLLNETETLKDKEIINEKQNDIVKQLQKSWDFELVEKSFIKTANELLKDVKYYE